MHAPTLSPVSLDPLAVLREYRALAPWGLRELAAVAGAILDASDIVPLNAAARARPTERTIRFYVTRGLVNAPDGRGTAAIYTYRHLLQVLAIKLRQMEGATLDAMLREFAAITGDAVERRVAAALGSALPPPAQLRLVQAVPGSPRGKVGRAVQAWLLAPDDSRPARAATGRRIPVVPGVEVLVDEHHPVLRLGHEDAAIAEALRRALGGLLGGTV